MGSKKAVMKFFDCSRSPTLVSSMDVKYAFYTLNSYFKQFSIYHRSVIRGILIFFSFSTVGSSNILRGNKGR